MSITVRILGCGSSGGVPRIAEGGPQWGDCDPGEPRNRRSRSSILVMQAGGSGGQTRALIDPSPDLRGQLIDAGIGLLDAVLVTHDHADQTHGLDDLRVVTINRGSRLDLWADAPALASLTRKFGYCFKAPPGSGYPPILNARELTPGRPFTVTGAGGELGVQAFPVGHGRIHALGYRIGPLAYTPDVDALDDAAFAALAGADCWIVDALRRRPHPSHAHLARTLEWIARVKPARAILTNMHVDMDYQTLKRELPPGVEPAFDGMTLTLAG